MKKAILLVIIAAILIIPGSITPQAADFAVQINERINLEPASVTPDWAVLKETKQTPKPAYPQETNSKAIDALIERMRSNKAANSIEGLTGESTFMEAVESIGEDKIKSAFLSYKSELIGYPAVVKYNFSNSEDGKLLLFDMVFFIMPEQRNGYEEQLKEFAQILEDGLDNHSPDGKYPFYRWKNDNYYISILSSESNYTSSGILASVNVIPFDKSNMPDIFPDIFGADIDTIYRSKMPSTQPEELIKDPWLYYIWYYGDTDISINFCFTVKGTEIKLCSAEYEVRLLDTGYEGMDKTFTAFGDSMEDILGPAASRDSGPRADKPLLIINWPGLMISACYDSSSGNYRISTEFSEEYFTAN